jgi:antitoxin MazE6
MKTAISLPDEVFEEGEKLARTLGKSRSELYRTALEDYIARHDADRIRAAIDRVLSEITKKDDDFVRSAAARVLEKSEW